MKNKYIKKSFLIAFSFIISIFFIGICNATPVSPTEDTPVQIQSVASFKNMNPKMVHSAIPTVLANGILKAKVITYFGIASNGEISLEYKLDDGEVIEIKGENIKKESYIGTPEGTITKDNDYVYYRIKGVFKIPGQEDVVLYEPADAGASSTTFATTTIIKKIEKEINGDSGGTISVFAGDQSKGDKGTVVVNVSSGAYSGNHNVVVDFLDESSIDQGSASSKTRENVISNVFVDVEGGVSEIASSIQIKNLPLQNKTKANKFLMQYQNGTEWDKVIKPNLSVDKSDRIYSFSAAKLGHYRVLESIILSNSSYRPENRIVVKAKVGSSYPGFEFKYLNEGDVVKIYNLKGKKIAELKSGTSDGFIWKGKKGTDNSGDWAESGTYIYQIKLKDGGNIISGTIAFVW